MRCKEEILHPECSEALRLPREAVAAPSLVGFQGQVGRGWEQPGLVEGVPAHGKGVGTGWSVRSLPT